MNVLILNTFDKSGGAAKAIYRFHKSLQAASVQSQMLVYNKISDDNAVICDRTLLEIIWNKVPAFVDNTLLTRWYSRQSSLPFSINLIPRLLNLADKLRKINPDIVQLNWVGASFFRVEALQYIKQPIVWRLPDMWAFTGGCHYAGGCERYKMSCGRCPDLRSNKERDLSRWIFNRKRKAWKGLDIVIVTPSKWMAGCARESTLFRERRIEVITTGVNTKLFQPVDKNIVREMYGLPKDKKLILFGAMSATSDKRKGYGCLVPALKKLSEGRDSKEIELVIFGASKPKNSDEICFPTHYLGYLNDDTSLALAYSASDVFVAPSLEDNLPNTVMESLACGTPVVAFNIGGIPDVVEHKQGGYLAKPFETEDLAMGISWVLEDEGRRKRLAESARAKALRECNQEVQTKRYVELYKDIIEERQYGRASKNG